MADTGWLKVAASEISTSPPPGEAGNPWYYTEWLALWQNYGTNSWMASDDQRFPPTTETIGWNWVVPVGSYPDNSVVTGIEYRIWAYQFQAGTAQSPVSVNPVTMMSGQKTIIDELPGNPATEPFLVVDPNDLPGGSTGPLRTDPPTHNVVIGGPGQVFGLQAGTRVSSFLSHKSLLNPDGAFHTFIRYACGEEYKYVESSIYLQYIEMKIHYDIPLTNIDIASDPSIAITVPVVELAHVHDMDALPVSELSIPTALLGGDTKLSASPEISLSFAMDISEGFIYIDSTCFPEVNVILKSPELQAVRIKDLASEPTIEVLFEAYGAGTRSDLSSSPTISIYLNEGLTGFKDLLIDEDDMLIEFSFPDDIDLQVNTNLGAAPFKYLSIEAKLEGDIILADECEEFIPLISLTIDADLGYTKGLDSNLSIYLTMDVDGLIVGTALEFEPLISLTIPKVNLRNKYAEPAPDHRTIFVCPEDRTIVITRKDKTIL